MEENIENKMIKEEKSYIFGTKKNPHLLKKKQKSEENSKT